MKIKISDSAFNDLQDMIDYYTTQGVVDVGSNFANNIIQQIQLLADHPDAGRIVPEFNQPHLRELIHSPFRVVYLREQNLITVIRVWRSERLLMLPE